MRDAHRPAGPPAARTRPSGSGVGRGSSPQAEAVSDALRRGTGDFLEQRRRIAVLQTAAAATLSVVGLYQFGVLRSVPEPRLPGLDADRVDASGEAYRLLRTPDSTIGIASAGLSLVLAGAGGRARDRDAVDPAAAARQEPGRRRRRPLPDRRAGHDPPARLLVVHGVGRPARRDRPRSPARGPSRLARPAPAVSTTRGGTVPSPRTVVVTGASAGVGRATARAFAEAGDDVALLARGAEGLAAAAAEVRSYGRRALEVVCDVSDADAVEAAAQRVEDELGPIDVWVNNAMTTVFSRVADITPHEFRRVTEVTYLGSVHGTMAALRRMRARDRGTVVQVGSALAYRGIPLQAAYCGAKHALRGFYDSLRAELVADGSGVRVVEVHMPGLNTPQFRLSRSHMPRRAQPVAPIYQPEVAARAVVYASRHPQRRTLWVGAPTVGTILGGTLAPRLMDQFLGRTNLEAQQTDEPEPAARPDYLDGPVPGDHGAHGPFDDVAVGRSPALAVSMHRPRVLAGAAATALLATAWRRR